MVVVKINGKNKQMLKMKIITHDIIGTSLDH